MIRKIIACLLATLFACTLLASCSNNDRERLTAHPWESAVGFIEFKDSGKICYNFESEDTSVSYFKLLSGDRINMYTDEGEELGMIFDYRFDGDILYIGEAKYKKAQLIELEDEDTKKSGNGDKTE